MSKSKKILKIIAIVLCIVLIAVMIPFSVIIIKPSVDFKKGIENFKYNSCIGISSRNG